MDRIVVTENLCRSFGPHVAVDRLTLSVDSGQIYGLLGPNGAGKTTTIRMLNTLLPPTAGTAFVAGWDIRKHVTEIRRVIGSVPQALSVEGALTAYENLLVFAKLHRVPRSQRKDRIARLLELLQLADRADSLVRTFSGGMIRRLELAQALVHEPQLLFLDEPTVGLDPIARRTFWDYLLDLRRRTGLSIIITTHYMEEAEALCDRIAIMHHGRVEAEGTPQALKDAAGVPEGTLEEVFVRIAGDSLEEGGDYRDVRRTRRTSQRLG
ncbi:MAG TPA: ATP-binding cassette domain-containing protein [Firmicutes bacterium]|nr:ATP-binding cassette domain-containing protein [Bacillota bacterium]